MTKRFPLHPATRSTAVLRTRQSIFRSSVSLAVAGLGCLVALASTSVRAEDAIEEVVVTGTRIVQPNLTSSSPIQVVTAQDVKLQGTTDIADLLNSMPQMFQNGKTDFSNTPNPLTGPGGMTTANLRGLGPQRTLVLIDGRRLGVGDADTGNPNPAPNLDQIPTQLIQRVDVVTGGASAVYGSDAIAGVLNFIMKKNFQGVEVDAQYGFNNHENHNGYMQGLEKAAGFPVPSGHVNDGKTKTASIIAGTDAFDDKANFTAYFNYRQADPVSQSSRDFSACKLNVNSTGVGSCGGSPNSNEFIDNPNGNFDYTVVGHQFLNWPQAGSSPPALFNSNPYQYLSRDDERYSAGFFSHYDFSDAATAYADFGYMKDTSITQVAPAALFEGGDPYNPTGGNLVNCANPLLSAQQQAAIGCDAAAIAADSNVDLLIGRRNVEGAGRQSTYKHENYRGVVGVKGKVWDGWSYDVYGQYYRSTSYQLNANYLSSIRADRALQVVSVGGTPTCKAKVDGSDPACVPWNIFSDGGVTPQQVAYLEASGAQNGKVTQKIVAGNLAGDLGAYGVKLPTATNGVGVAFGAEYRSEALEFTSDPILLSGDLSGFGGAAVNINGKYDVRDLYTEIRIPLVQDSPGVHDLSFDTGYRYSDYSTAGGVSTYKFDVQYAPTTDIRFRASYQRATRAPNIIELFNPQSVTNTSDVSSDPCAGASPTASAAECARTGVTAAQYGHITQCPAGQCATLQGGNTALKPEKADTVSFGFTLTPSELPDFTGSVDYFQIKVKDEIGNIPIAVSLANCLSNGDPVFCANVVRSSAGGLFGTTVSGGGYLVGTNVNVATVKASGVDLQAAYRWQLESWGTLTTTLAASYAEKLATQSLPTEKAYDCAGLYGNTCQVVTPQLRGNLRVSWQTPWKLLLSTQLRHIGSVSLETNSSDPALSNGAFQPFAAKLAAVNYVDLSAIWDVMPNVSLRAGLDNLFDKDPPLVSSLVAGTGTPNAYSTYDLLGRTIFLGVTAKF